MRVAQFWPRKWLSFWPRSTKGLLIRILEMQGQDNRVPLADRERVKTEAAVLRAKTEFLDVFIFKGQDEPDADS